MSSLRHCVYWLCRAFVVAGAAYDSKFVLDLFTLAYITLHRVILIIFLQTIIIACIIVYWREGSLFTEMYSVHNHFTILPNYVEHSSVHFTPYLLLTNCSQSRLQPNYGRRRLCTIKLWLSHIVLSLFKRDYYCVRDIVWCRVWMNLSIKLYLVTSK